MIWARCTGVMGVPMKWEIARIFVVGTGGSGFCAEAAPSGVVGFFMAVVPGSSSPGPFTTSVGWRIIRMAGRLPASVRRHVLTQRDRRGACAAVDRVVLAHLAARDGK